MTRLARVARGRGAPANPLGRAAGLVGLTLLVTGCGFSIERGPAALAADVLQKQDGVHDVVRRGERPARVVDRWPARWGDYATAGTAEAGEKGVVVALDAAPNDLRFSRLGEHHFPLPDEASERAVRALAKGRVTPAGFDFRLEGSGGYVLKAAPEGERADEPRAGETGVFVSGRADHVRAGRSRIEIERTWMVRRGPRDAADEGGAQKQSDAGAGLSRGVAVILPGLYGQPRFLFRSVEDVLVDDGWTVVRLLAPPSRFMQLYEIDLGQDMEGDAGAGHDAGALAARWFDERLAEVAYAAEAGVRWAWERERGLSARPLVLVGMSGGALAAPAAAARFSDALGRVPDAAVLVAGGENLFEIAATSAYTEMIDAARWEWPGKNEGDVLPPERWITRPSARYANESTLDPGALPGVLRRSRVLLVHGRGDKAVPAELGEAFWRRLGRPERWAANAGHLGLFVRLWISVDELANWLDRAAPQADG
ncbi:MAG: hypothetical protein AAF235_01575 [Planctomycetota bacterium]